MFDAAVATDLRARRRLQTPRQLREIEKRQIAHLVGDLKAHPDRPDVSWQEWSFLSDDATLKRQPRLGTIGCARSENPLKARKGSRNLDAGDA
jgi:hypothetical protein